MKTMRFAGLNGLRFISIFFVVLHHLFTFKNYFGLTDIDFPILGLIGLYGIHFFFMGSGFLITYLLLIEQATAGRINLRNFYARRILRIWPAYFLLIIIALLLVLKLPFFRIPELTDDYLTGNFNESNKFFLFFLPHIAPYYNSTAPYVHHTYTIGIEEQFYFLWGLLFCTFRKYIYWIFVVLLICMPLLNVLHNQLFIYTSTVSNASISLVYIKKALFFLKYSKISTFVIGSLFGYAYFRKKKWIFYLKSKWVQVSIYMVFGLSILFQVELSYIQYEYMALIMGLIMIIATFRDESIFNYSAHWLDFLGKISYGIYLFHIFAIFFVLKLFVHFNLKVNNLWQLLLLCFITLALSILFGLLSYRYIESPFLKIKQQFRRIKIDHI